MIVSKVDILNYSGDDRSLKNLKGQVRDIMENTIAKSPMPSSLKL